MPRSAAIPRKTLAEGSPFNELGDDVRHPTVFADVIDGDDVRVRKARG